MSFETAFNLMGFAMLIGLGYSGIKVFSIALLLRQRNAEYVGKGWDGRVTTKQLKKLKSLHLMRFSKKRIDQYLRYSIKT
ncbi:MAG: hypothetical protein ACSLE0_16695 [Chitinophagaceae bacterium]